MKQILPILRYIIQNNSPFAIPYRLGLAFLYQGYKRCVKTIFSKRLFNGQKIFLYPNNCISSAFVYASHPDKQEIAALRQLADNQSVFLDIGANIGAYSIMLMDKVKKLYAFEAHPHTANLCKMNFLLNGLSEEQVIAKAVSDNNQSTYFSNLDDGDPLNTIVQNSSQAIEVPSITLDQFIQEKQFESGTNFLLKIDVEGFEHHVLQGAADFLKNQPIKAILLETFSTEHQAIQQCLEQLGFKMKMISKHNMLAYR
ncbi:FkbM family methyltransferase [Candidatus Berkiella aquae]|uniref:FkbM family methyltransferase n=1 Tax=Candidatus Berkiella aquae TaxID=295108 RepID=A0A0Q9YKM6_9GAMM|nr:FkbM family methyltransferase [Candidatus Berkiella aquae]MCS5712302.1 FkbM family methyltransferase [Candidatus Berkiella aquae]